MLDTFSVLPLYFKDAARSKRLHSDWLYFQFLNRLCLHVKQYDPGLSLVNLVSHGPSYN